MGCQDVDGCVIKDGFSLTHLPLDKVLSHSLPKQPPGTAKRILSFFMGAGHVSSARQIRTTSLLLAELIHHRERRDIQGLSGSLIIISVSSI
ncbi:hypothetical protein A0H81_09286 [Grifola frondosa]|uniref:Uncharacterized protein n=1 Tax=Grifola frondosa TaxID=5627 RepID=A0A1C7M1G4_GRIFR|nr:hypothetical protein A0H81_09286 [Grifola frondosa]